MIDTNRKTYTDRVVRGDDGVYRWQAPLNREQQIKVVKIVFGVCGGLCVLFILGALILDPSMLTAVLLSTLAVLLIAGLPCWLYLRGDIDRLRTLFALIEQAWEKGDNEHEL